MAAAATEEVIEEKNIPLSKEQELTIDVGSSYINENTIQSLSTEIYERIKQRFRALHRDVFVNDVVRTIEYITSTDPPQVSNRKVARELATALAHAQWALEKTTLTIVTEQEVLDGLNALPVDLDKKKFIEGLLRVELKYEPRAKSAAAVLRDLCLSIGGKQTKPVETQCLAFACAVYVLARFAGCGENECAIFETRGRNHAVFLLDGVFFIDSGSSCFMQNVVLSDGSVRTTRAFECGGIRMSAPISLDPGGSKITAHCVLAYSIINIVGMLVENIENPYHIFDTFIMLSGGIISKITPSHRMPFGYSLVLGSLYYFAVYSNTAWKMVLDDQRMRDYFDILRMIEYVAVSKETDYLAFPILQRLLLIHIATLAYKDRPLSEIERPLRSIYDSIHNTGYSVDGIVLHIIESVPPLSKSIVRHARTCFISRSSPITHIATLNPDFERMDADNRSRYSALESKDFTYFGTLSFVSAFAHTPSRKTTASKDRIELLTKPLADIIQARLISYRRMSNNEYAQAPISPKTQKICRDNDEVFMRILLSKQRYSNPIADDLVFENTKKNMAYLKRMRHSVDKGMFYGVPLETWAVPPFYDVKMHFDPSLLDVSTKFHLEESKKNVEKDEHEEDLKYMMLCTVCSGIDARFKFDDGSFPTARFCSQTCAKAYFEMRKQGVERFFGLSS